MGFLDLVLNPEKARAEKEEKLRKAARKGKVRRRPPLVLEAPASSCMAEV